MHNPFEVIANRLSNLEALVLESLQMQRSGTNHTATEVGGIELAQEVTRLSKQRIYALVSQRSIPHSKPAGGNKLYFNRAELLDWVARGKREEAQEKGR